MRPRKPQRTIALALAAVITGGCGARIDEAKELRALVSANQLETATPTPESSEQAKPSPTGDEVAEPLSEVPSDSPTTVAPKARVQPGVTPTAPSVGATSTSGPNIKKTDPAPPPGSPGDPSPTATTPDAGEPADLPDAIRVSGPNSQGVSDTEIKVGVLAPLSGAAGFLGELQVNAIRAYLADVNANGGVRGRKYRIIVADDRFEPAVQATAARRLIDDDKVFSLITLLGNSIAPYVASRGVPTIVFGGTPHAFASKYPTVFPVGFNVVDTNLSAAYILKNVLKLPIDTVALTYETTNVPWGDWTEYAKKAWEALGVEVKSVDRFNLSDGDCTQLVVKMRSLDVDYWQFAQTLGWPLCQSAMAKQGWSPSVGRGGPFTDDINFVGQVGQAAEGLYAMTNGVQVTQNMGQPWPYDPTGIAPEAGHYAATMKRFSPRSANEAGLEGVWAQSFWTSAKLLHEAVLRQVDAVTWDGVNQWIQSQDNWSGGLIGPANFTPNCKTSSKGMWIYQYEWDGNALHESDWRPYGGPATVPPDLKNKIVSGAGECYLSAIADAELTGE